nr:Rha family transcriptional regulator [uncultured Fretibacterium sp.]
MLQSRHKRPTIWPTGHRGPYFVGHFVFEGSSYISEQKKKLPLVYMTKDGFTFLVMGYRGKRAAAFKETYIQRFNDMECFIRNTLAARVEFPAFTDAVMNAYEEPKFYHFSNEADMINRIVLGMSAKKFRELHGLEKGVSIRPYLSNAEAEAVLALQRADIGLLEVIPEFERRRDVLAGMYTRRMLAA